MTPDPPAAPLVFRGEAAPWMNVSSPEALEAQRNGLAEAQRLIDSALPWDDTPQGENFWRQVDAALDKLRSDLRAVDFVPVTWLIPVPDHAPTSLIETLAMARAALKGHWGQGVFAEDTDGDSVDHHVISRNPSLVKVCALGAIYFVNGPWGQEAVRTLAAVLLDKTGNAGIPDFNDKAGRTEAEMLKVFDAAILRAAHREGA